MAKNQSYEYLRMTLRNMNEVYISGPLSVLETDHHW